MPAVVFIASLMQNISLDTLNSGYALESSAIKIDSFLERAQLAPHRTLSCLPRRRGPSSLILRPLPRNFSGLPGQRSRTLKWPAHLAANPALTRAAHMGRAQDIRKSPNGAPGTYFVGKAEWKVSYQTTTTVINSPMPPATASIPAKQRRPLRLASLLDGIFKTGTTSGGTCWMCIDYVCESVLVSGYNGQVVSWLVRRSKRISRSMSGVHSAARVCAVPRRWGSGTNYRSC